MTIIVSECINYITLYGFACQHNIVCLQMVVNLFIFRSLNTSVISSSVM